MLTTEENDLERYSSHKKWVTLTGADWCILDAVKALQGAVSKHTPISQLEQVLFELTGLSVCATDLGRTAIYLGLKALGLGNGEGVVVQTLVCPTVVNAIVDAGCKPVFADVSAGQLFVTAAELEPLLTTPNVRAVLIPHLFCMSAPMGEIEALCHHKGVFLIDDAAQGFGLSCEGRYLSTFGDLGILSFGPYKGLSSLRGGALVSRDQELIIRAREFSLIEEKIFDPLRRCISGYLKYKLRSLFLNYRDKKNGLHEKNNNLKPFIYSSYQKFMLTGFDAYLTCNIAKRYDDILSMRASNSRKVYKILNCNKGIKFYGSPDLPYVKIPVRLIGPYSARDVVLGFRKLKVEAESIYLPAHLRSPFKQFVTGPLPNAEQVQKQSFLLPNPYHQDAGAIDRLASAVEALTRSL